jgi:protein-S-isoprenylcysteine O-methyltransferase Ste14
MNPDIVTPLLWGAWIISWWAAAFWRDRAVKRPPLATELWYRAFVVAGAVLMFNYFAPGSSRWMVWTPGTAARWAMVVLVAAGLLFTWWARMYLGRLWSSGITRKANHRIIDTGPYALVRHPIYTGVILAECATAVQGGSIQAFAGAAVMFVGWYIKARAEEAFLRDELGRDVYDTYAQRVPMLLPFPRG